MDVIDINGKKYDPYFILGVSRDDSSAHITKEFRRKAKKYHPDKYTDKRDKKKYERYFQILLESFEYIKEKRNGRKSIHIIDKSKYKHDVIENKKCDIDEFNKEFDNVKSDPNDYGYGDNYTRLKTIEEYDNLDVNLVNLFINKKFSNKQFNKIFEWHKQQNEEEDASNKLIHRTTDGFYGYNSGSVRDCSLVSSFNGLMITGDDLGERGIGYWGDNYSDYRMVHKGIQNPTRRPRIPRHFQTSDKINKTNTSIKKNEYISNEEIENIINTKTLNNEQDILDKKQYNDLLEKEKHDKELIRKYIHKTLF